MPPQPARPGRCDDPRFRNGAGGKSSMTLRRRRAASLNEIAWKLGCAASSVMRWRDAFRRRGPAGLQVRTAPGRPPQLPQAQQRRLARRLLKGAMAHVSDRAVDDCSGRRGDPEHVRYPPPPCWPPDAPARVESSETRGSGAARRRGKDRRVEAATRVGPGKQRHAAEGPSRLHRRVRLPLDPECAEDLGRPEGGYRSCGFGSATTGFR